MNLSKYLPLPDSQEYFTKTTKKVPLPEATAKRLKTLEDIDEGIHPHFEDQNRADGFVAYGNQQVILLKRSDFASPNLKPHIVGFKEKKEEGFQLTLAQETHSAHHGHRRLEVSRSENGEVSGTWTKWTTRGRQSWPLDEEKAKLALVDLHNDFHQSWKSSTTPPVIKRFGE